MQAYRDSRVAIYYLRNLLSHSEINSLTQFSHLNKSLIASSSFELTSRWSSALVALFLLESCRQRIGQARSNAIDRWIVRWFMQRPLAGSRLCCLRSECTGERKRRRRKGKPKKHIRRRDSPARRDAELPFIVPTAIEREKKTSERKREQMHYHLYKQNRGRMRRLVTSDASYQATTWKSYKKRAICMRLDSHLPIMT